MLGAGPTFAFSSAASDVGVYATLIQRTHGGTALAIHSLKSWLFLPSMSFFQQLEFLAGWSGLCPHPPDDLYHNVFLVLFITLPLAFLSTYGLVPCTTTLSLSLSAAAAAAASAQPSPHISSRSSALLFFLRMHLSGVRMSCCVVVACAAVDLDVCLPALPTSSLYSTGAGISATSSQD